MKNGFTLVELSIVLVIIGLLVGGILVGQSLIESAQIKAQVRQFQQYDIALQNFYQKFRHIPGDAPYSFGTKVYPDSFNGWGNGWIEGNVGTGNNLAGEVSSYFTDLSESKMISEQYKMVSNQYKRGKGKQFPLGKIGDGGIMIHSTFDKRIQYFFGMSVDSPFGPYGTYNAFSPEGVISPAVAFAIDKKMDDSLAETGKVFATSSRTSLPAGNYSPPANWTLLPDTTDGVCINVIAGADTYNVANTDSKACKLRVEAQFYR